MYIVGHINLVIPSDKFCEALSSQCDQDWPLNSVTLSSKVAILYRLVAYSTEIADLS